MAIQQQISALVVEHIKNRYPQNATYANKILEAVRQSLNGSSLYYPFAEHIGIADFPTEPQKDDFQGALSKINEKEARRKKEGVFYTDKDVTDYVVANTFLNFLCPGNKQVYGFDAAIRKILATGRKNVQRLLSASVFDPTCGAGEFLLSALSIKILLNKKLKIASTESIISTIEGNDIEKTSTDISKLRLFFAAIDSHPGILDPISLFHELNSHFSNNDAVGYDGQSFRGKDIIVGNPPYVEYRDFPGKSRLAYGNVYADVLHYAADSLNNLGIMAFVIPLSFVSTVRMKAIRDYLLNTTQKQIVINFADRPDALFSSVHQKLTILIAQKTDLEPIVLSSSYNYWYQEERDQLFNDISIIPLTELKDGYWPKIGNRTELSIFKKMDSFKGESLLALAGKDKNSTIFLNQRGCFWMKAFSKDMCSNSYAPYSFSSKVSPFVFCLINSSLFFLIWILISDGWHVTNKELSFMKIPKSIGDIQDWRILQNKLEQKLEQTKVYVGTKQVDYEYKHKLCKDIIDEIDDNLASVYKLSQSQLQYIKSFALKYRLGDGA